MSKIAVVTDSNSGITQERGKELGIFVLPMPFYIDGELYFEDISLTQEDFYKKLQEDADISTSQPSPGDLMDFWENILKEYDEIVHIPMSSGLSGSCQTAMTLADDYDGKVHVVDNQRISVTQEQSVYDAMALVKAGKSAEEIKQILEEEKLEASIYIMVDTLKYLKKGGRITPAAAALGSMLNLKPVLQLQGEKLDSFAKVRGVKAAKRTMLKAIKNDLETRFAGKKMVLGIAYTSRDEEEVQKWKEEVQEAFAGYEIVMNPLSLSVSCHIGPGSLAVTCTKVVEA
jgi:DegV family protein with EDD domain